MDDGDANEKKTFNKEEDEVKVKEVKMFTVKRWNAVAMWSWDVTCDTCAICKLPLNDSCMKCQNDVKQGNCFVVWGECNHSFHNCCIASWVNRKNKCPLCQREWVVQKISN